MRSLTISDPALLAAKLKYRDVVLADSPVGYWPLDETSGTTAFDQSGHGANGTYTNGPTLAASSIAGGTVCPTFDGSNDYVDLGTQAALDLPVASPGFTLEGWGRPTATNFATALLVEHQPSGTQSVRGAIGMAMGGENSGQTNGAGFTNGSPSWIILAGGSWSTNVIRHVVYTYAGGTNGATKLFVNGVQVASGTRTAAKGGGRWLIGCRQGINAFWAGQIAHVAMYQGVLADDRVAAHYAAGI